MPLPSGLRCGRAYCFYYPRYNYLGLPPRLERRRVHVEVLRDLDDNPLDVTTCPRNPLLRRGRWLMTGFDLDREAQRSFYLESMTQVQEMTEQELCPYRGAGYLVLTPLGQAAGQSTRLHDAASLLLARPAGILCKVLGMTGTEPDSADDAMEL